VIKGVRISTAEGEQTVVYADLVVDTTGRSAKGVKSIQEIGYEAPPVSSYDPFITYAVRYYEKSDTYTSTDDEAVIATFATPPNGTKIGLICEIEKDQVLLLLSGNRKVQPDSNALEDWAAYLEHPIIYNKLKHLKPITKVKTLKAGPCRLNYYNKIRTPSNFVVVGDAFAKFNPIYGQGMGCAALCAVTLDAVLRKTETLDDFSTLYHKKMGIRYAFQWLFPKAVDDLFPNPGDPPKNLLTRFLHWQNYVKMECSTISPLIQKRSTRVMSGIDNPMILFDFSYHYELVKCYLILRFQSIVDNSKKVKYNTQSV